MIFNPFPHRLQQAFHFDETGRCWKHMFTVHNGQIHLNKASYQFQEFKKETYSAESAVYHPAKSGIFVRDYFNHCHTNQMYCHVDVKFKMMPCGTSLPSCEL